VKAACKFVIGERRKGSGMRRGEDGADAPCHMRTLFKGGDRPWDAPGILYRPELYIDGAHRDVF
jgi:hypothetical protein